MCIVAENSQDRYIFTDVNQAEGIKPPFSTTYPSAALHLAYGKDFFHEIYKGREILLQFQIMEKKECRDVVSI